ncbi:MAG: DVU_1553 family AMP-dependent CoA ligase [Ruminococcus sp.]|jgi:phenylacetate-CoA ligase
MRSVLDDWIREKQGIRGRKEMDLWQEKRIGELISYVCEKSSFYRERFAGYGLIKRKEDFQKLPLMSWKDLTESGLKMLCVSQGEIERVVSLQTSGTQSRSKRLYFTRDDLELTVDFFHHGMKEVTKPGEKTAVFLPCRRPDSVGDLLLKGLKRLGAVGYGLGPVEDPKASLHMLQREKIETFVSTPMEALALAEHAGKEGVELSVKKILVSTDYLAKSVRERIEKGLGCSVRNHFGMTEAGLGGAVECSCCHGMHIRENDLLMEVVDPLTQKTLPDGQEGELVLTTLTRRGMPLIRYRTGDLAVLDHGRCGCGSFLTRIVKTGGRLIDIIGGDSGKIRLTKTDEILFSIDGLLDYGVEYQERDKTLSFHLVFFPKEEGKAALAKERVRDELLSEHNNSPVSKIRVTWEETKSWRPQYGRKRVLKRG